MEIERINPDGLNHRPFYSHVVRSSSKYLIHISGQVAIDRDGDSVDPSQVAAHVDQAYANLDVALEGAGLIRRHVVKVTTFVVEYGHDEKWPIIRAAHSSFFGSDAPAWTVVGVEALARPDLVIEIEATAAAD